jgi:hypothetical protein
MSPAFTEELLIPKQAMKKIIVLILLSLTLTSEHTLAQYKYYEDSFSGGNTAGGYSPEFNLGGTGAFTLNIAAGSTIRKAFLIAGRHGNAANITVVLNGINYTFNATNQASPVFQSPSYGGNSGVHIIDVTANINPTVNSYSLVVPPQGGPSNRYNDFALWVAYNNSGMTTMSTVLFLNTEDFATDMNYILNVTNPINISAAVGISLMSGYLCDNANDGEKVKVNSYLLGTIGNNDVNSGTCGGPLGSYNYSNNTLTGLSDDSQNLVMASADALSDVRTKVASNATSIAMQFTAVAAGNTTNAIWAVFVAYNPSTTLPVELTQFSGRAVESVNQLDWTTASEINCDYFNVEASKDGESFITGGSVQGAGNSTVTNNYSFTDENPFPGTTYYRLKQMDFDGQYEYSKVIDVTNINYKTSSVDVYNPQGQLIMSVKEFRDNSSLKNLVPGIYLLHFHTSKGLLVKKIMRQPE